MNKGKKLFSSLLLLSFLVLLAYADQQVADGDQTETSDKPSLEDFQNWMKTHDKAYKSTEILIERFKAFIKNHFIVQHLNKLYHDKTEFTLNQFADMSIEEFRTKVLMRNTMSGDLFDKISREKLLTTYNDEYALPDSFDWRTLGAVTPVKDQGSVGTCWAFSTAENLEGVYQVKGNPLTKLSVEQIVDCDGSDNATTAQADCGVYGGWPFMALEYVKRAGGIASEEDYPYCVGTKNPCYPCQAPGYNKTDCGPPVPYCLLKDSCEAKFNASKFVPNLKVADWMRTSQNETDIAAQLMSHGPLSVALNAEMLQFYHRGIFDPIMCNPQALNHAVLLVGWGNSRSFLHGSRDYWIVKNSWGEKWGESGYFRIVRNKGKCGINTQVVTAILE